MAFTAVKDPDATLDYSIDWTDWLAEATDTISTSSWTAEAGITIEDDTNTTAVATVWLSGGTVNEQYDIVNEIVTAGGRTDNRTLTVRVREK